MPTKKKASTFPITVHTMEAELKFHLSVSENILVNTLIFDIIIILFHIV